MEQNNKIVILGGGISGLATAFLLDREGYDVLVLEKNKEVGGSMNTTLEDSFLFDKGPNSGLETVPLISEIVEEVGLKDEWIYASSVSNKRYILRNNKLHPLPMGPSSLLSSELFSASGKFRLLLEPFIGRSNDGYYQSIAQFVKRRLGQEFLDYAINPFVAGVYAGNPEELSVKSAFPKLYELEEKYGGLIVGTVKSIRERKKREEKSKQSARMFSFLNGMQSFPKAIANKLGDKVKTFCEVIKIEKKENGFNVVYNNANEITNVDCDIVILTLPAYIASYIVKDIDPVLTNHLESIYYPPVMVLYLGYKKEDIGQPLDGFGYLIPQKENKSYLGAIWSSAIFQNRAKEGYETFTLFVGGSRNPQIFELDKDLIIKKVIDEFNDVMKIKSQPYYKSYKYWNKAIPQYNIGYIEHERYFDEFEKKNPGIIISGNYRGGISVGDCIKNSEITFSKVKNLIKEKISV